MATPALRRPTTARRNAVLASLVAVGALAAQTLSATTVVPLADNDLLARADVVVHGVVLSNEAAPDALGRPETVTVIDPLEVLKGDLAGTSTLVLHQLGAELPDGRFFKLWGRPEYVVGHEVVVFAVARPEGDYQTAELLLGKFEVEVDDQGGRFAVPPLSVAAPFGVTVVRSRNGASPDTDDGTDADVDVTTPRELTSFLESLRASDTSDPSAPRTTLGPPAGMLAPRPALAPSTSAAASPSPVPGDEPVAMATRSPIGRLTAIVHPQVPPDLQPPDMDPIGPSWVNLGGLWRYNNGASAVWTLDGTANITGGAVAEATASTATWDNDPNSTIGYTIGPGGVNYVHLDALSSPCGWTTCMSGGGVIGCGGPSGGGQNTWRGETYWTITTGEVWLRSFCTTNLFDSITVQSVLTHELGHTLGLGHSDQGTSAHDTCAGDESLAQMRSYVQHRTTLGTDDTDAIRWLYGDGGNSCTGSSSWTLSVAKTGGGTGTVTSAPTGIDCGATCSATFAGGTVVTLSAAATAGSTFAGWSGDADCLDGSVTMDAAKTCTATFNLVVVVPPDVVVSVLTAPSAAVAGSTISVTDTTANQGGAATASTTRFFLSSNSTYESADTLLGSRAVPALAASASSAGTTGLVIPATTTTGTWYVVALADAAGVLSESSESNNTRSVSLHVGPPDLTVSALSAPSLSGAGLTIAVTSTTKNQTGTGPAAASVTRFFLSTDSTFSAGDVAIGSVSVPALLPAGTSASTVSLLIPLGTAPAKYWLFAVADADNTLAETSETNNTRSVTLTIGPDLIVSALSAPTTGGAGMPLTVTDSTKNQGGGSTVLLTTTRFYLSSNSTWEAGDVPLGSRTIPVLVLNGVSSASTTVTIPATTAPGSYYVIARADDGSVVAESDETNNTKSVLVRVSPDLMISVLTVPTTAVVGATISVTDTTRNQGQGIAGATTTRFYLSTNTTFDASDVPLGSRAVALLASGATSAATTSVTIPAGTAGGAWYVLARADADGAVAESSETNNTLSRAITLTP